MSSVCDVCSFRNEKPDAPVCEMCRAILPKPLAKPQVVLDLQLGSPSPFEHKEQDGVRVSSLIAQPASRRDGARSSLESKQPLQPIERLSAAQSISGERPAVIVSRPKRRLTARTVIVSPVKATTPPLSAPIPVDELREPSPPTNAAKPRNDLAPAPPTRVESAAPVDAARIPSGPERALAAPAPQEGAAVLDVKGDLARHEWERLNAIGIGDAVKVHCPSCGLGYDIAALNCGVFVCGFYSDGQRQCQLPPHDEAFAQTMIRAGRLTDGCGKQCRWDPASNQLVLCTGR